MNNLFWSNAANWTNGLPDSNKVAVFDGSTGARDCAFDNTVVAANRTVAGIRTDNAYANSLRLVAGFGLTVSSTTADTGNGFKWSSGSIFQNGASDVLIITGGGSAANNKWSGGTINSNTVQSNLSILGSTTLQITGGAATLGDNIYVGSDNAGGSTLEFKDQTATLQVTNNGAITNSGNPLYTNPNQILFDTDLVNTAGTATKGLGTTSADSFIDNYGVITRSNPGMYQTDLPIKNENNSNYTAQLDLQSDLWISGASMNKTANYSLDNEAGNTILENGCTLKTKYGAFLNGGQLMTYGSSGSTISREDTSLTALTVSGGVLKIQADNPGSGGYGSLAIGGSMWFDGGTFVDYVNGGTGGQQTQLTVSGTLTLRAGAHLQISAVGTLQSGLTWTPITGVVSGTLTFDSGASFTINYPNNVGITVTSR